MRKNPSRRVLSWAELPVGSMFKVVINYDGAPVSGDLADSVFRKTSSMPYSLTDSLNAISTFLLRELGDPRPAPPTNGLWVFDPTGRSPTGETMLVTVTDALRVVECLDPPTEKVVYSFTPTFPEAAAGDWAILTVDDDTDPSAQTHPASRLLYVPATEAFAMGSERAADGQVKAMGGWVDSFPAALQWLLGGRLGPEVSMAELPMRVANKPTLVSLDVLDDGYDEGEEMYALTDFSDPKTPRA